MRINEFANAEEQLALWKLISDGVWTAVPLEFTASLETPPYPHPPVLGMVPSHRFTLYFAQMDS